MFPCTSNLAGMVRFLGLYAGIGVVLLSFPSDAPFGSVYTSTNPQPLTDAQARDALCECLEQSTVQWLELLAARLQVSKPSVIRDYLDPLFSVRCSLRETRFVVEYRHHRGSYEYFGVFTPRADGTWSASITCRIESKR
jgi:hypothetical protein